jgi:hypothetical protein
LRREWHRYGELWLQDRQLETWREELDTSLPDGRTLYVLVSEALQLLEHVSLVRAGLDFGFQGELAYAHMRYHLTRYGVSVRDAGAVEHVLGGGTFSR